MKKKILYTATTDIHLLNFHLPYLQWFKTQGYEVHVACNGNRKIPFADKTWSLSIGRSPIDRNNIFAYKKLKKIISNNRYEIIHSHTPMGGVLTRLAARTSRKNGTRVLYTAHGFHFYKGSSLKNWLLFFPIEWLLSNITDGIITINNEDYEAINNFGFRSKDKFKIDGIGINPDRLKFDNSDDKIQLKENLGFNKDDIIILYIAEMIPRKNHWFIFKSISAIVKNNSNVKFIFAGGLAVEGENLKNYSKNNGIDDSVFFLGYQKDIAKYIYIADIGISSSIAEGLPIGIAEIMTTGLPVVISDIRGHNELVVHEKSGFLYNLKDKVSFIKYVNLLVNDIKLRNQIGEIGAKRMSRFHLQNPLKQMIEIYDYYLN
ncbi:MAG: glycosyltransferase family 4 protein [Flavobacteriaceae bacterium]|nr:glycosyltransferase family 4 protein [Flavobacteriaceae bacterium]